MVLCEIEVFGRTPSKSLCNGVAAPTNGTMGNCSATLASGAACVPGCDAGYRQAANGCSA